MTLRHNSKLEEGEPKWSDVDQNQLPRIAHADQGEENKKTSWKYPHHWVKNPKIDEDKNLIVDGTMFLSKSGLNAAWAAAHGARSGKKASKEVIKHLQKHRKDLGMEKDFLAESLTWTNDTLVYQEDINKLNDMFNKLDESIESYINAEKVIKVYEENKDDVILNEAFVPMFEALKMEPSMEGLKEIAKKIWEFITKMYKAIVDFIKRVLMKTKWVTFNYTNIKILNDVWNQYANDTSIEFCDSKNCNELLQFVQAMHTYTYENIDKVAYKESPKTFTMQVLLADLTSICNAHKNVINKTKIDSNSSNKSGVKFFEMNSKRMYKKSNPLGLGYKVFPDFDTIGKKIGEQYQKIRYRTEEMDAYTRQMQKMTPDENENIKEDMFKFKYLMKAFLDNIDMFNAFINRYNTETISLTKQLMEKSKTEGSYLFGDIKDILEWNVVGK